MGVMRATSGAEETAERVARCGLLLREGGLLLREGRLLLREGQQRRARPASREWLLALWRYLCGARVGCSLDSGRIS
jgi:hypothetical protein